MAKRKTITKRKGCGGCIPLRKIVGGPVGRGPMTGKTIHKIIKK